MASAWLNTWLNSWGNSWGTVTTAQSSGDSRKRKDEKKKHSSIYEIQEKANRELIKLYEKTPEVLEQSAPIEISIPAPKIKPSEALVTVPVLPIPEPFIPKIQSLNIPVYMPVAVKPTKQVIEKKISIPDEMDDEEAIAAVLALLQEVEA